jgi:hypothetical protein
MLSYKGPCLALALLPALLAPLGGCGFEPLYAKSVQAEYDPILAAIKIARIANPADQPEAIGIRLLQDLRERLNPHNETVEPQYILHVTLNVARHDLGITRSATASRSEVTVAAAYYLTTAHGDERVWSSQSNSSSLFNILDDGYATQIAFDNATQLAVDDVSRDIELRLAFFARNRRDHS